MKKLLIYWILFFCSFGAIAQKSKNSLPIIPADQINQLLVLEPVTYISLINKGNQSEPSDSIGQISKALWMDLVAANKGRIPIGKMIADISDHEKAFYKSEVEDLFVKADNRKTSQNLKIPPLLYQIMEENNSRYVMLSYLSGFTRRKGNMGGQVAKSIGIGILTMGMYAPVPVKAYSNIYVLILDKETSQIAYYKKSLLAEKEPLEQKVLSKQFNQIFKGYFF